MIRNEKAVIRLSERCLSQPAEFHQSLAHILWSKIFNRACDPVHKKNWRVYEKKNSSLNRAAPARSLPVKRLVSRHHDLAGLTEKILKKYFHNHTPPVTVKWGKRKTRYRLGYYHAGERAVCINPVLDHPEVPSFVIESILYHEILHHVIPPENHAERQVHHSRFFKRAEQSFPGYSKTEAWLKDHFQTFIKKYHTAK